MFAVVYKTLLNLIFVEVGLSFENNFTEETYKLLHCKARNFCED